jgi:hypothetical protein
MANSDREIDVKANVTGLAKAESDIDKVARDRTAKVDVEAQTTDLDRYQRRLLADLQSTYSKIEPRLTFDVAGEETRRKLEAGLAKLSDSIRLEIPVDLQEAADLRQKLQSKVDELKNIEKRTQEPPKAPDLFVQFDEKQLRKWDKKVGAFLAKQELTVDNTSISSKGQLGFMRSWDKLKEQIASEELTVDNLALSDRAKLKLTRQFDKFIEEQRAKELTFENTKFSEKAKFSLGKQFDKFIEEQRSKELTVDNTAVSLKEQTKFLQRVSKLQAQIASEAFTFENTQLSDQDAFKFLQKFDKFKIQVELDTEKARLDLIELQKEAADRMMLRPDFYAVDSSEWFSELDALNVKADLDFSQAEIEWDRFLQKYEQKNWEAKVTPSVDMAPVDSFIDRVRARLRNAKFQAEVGSLKADDFDFDAFRTGEIAEGMSWGKKLSKGLAEVGAGAAGAIPKLLSFKGVLLLVIAAVAILLPPLLALVAGLATLAPGLLAIGVPIAAIALGLDGIKNAAKAVQPEFEALKKTMADTFENGMPGMTGFTTQFERLKAEFFPLLTQELPKVAQGLTSMFSGVVDAVSSEKGLGNLRNIIDNVAEGLERAKGGMAGFTEGLLQLISGISEKFPGIGDWFTELGEKFAKNMTEWTTIEDENGFTKLERLIANVRTGIEGLTGVFQGFWNQGLKDISDPNFGKGMESFFEGVREFVTNTLPALSEGFKELARLFDTLDPLFKLIGAGTNGAKAYLDPGGTVKDMVDRANQVKEAGGSFWEQFLAAVTETGPVDPFKGLPGKGKEAGKNARTEFDEGFNGGVPGQPGSPMPTPTTTPEAAPDTGWWDAFKLKVSTGITEMKTWFSNLWVNIQTTAATAFATLYTSMSTFLAGIPLFFANLPLLIGSALGQITATIFTFSVNLLTFFVNLPAQIAGALAGVPAAIATAFGGITATVMAKGAEVMAEVSTWPGRILGALSGLAGILISAGVELVSGLISGTSQKFGELTAELSTWPAKCKAAVGNMLGALVSAGADLVAGFISGFTSRAGEALATVRRWAGDIISAAAGVFKINSPSKVFMEIGENVGKGFEIGLGNSADGVIKQANDMFEKVIAAGDTSPEGLKTLQEVLGLQAQAADLNSVGGSRAAKAEAQRMKDFNSLLQARLDMRSKELGLITQQGTAAAKAAGAAGKNVTAFSDQIKQSLEPLTQITGDMLAGAGSSSIYEAGKVDSQTKAELDALKLKQQQLDLQKSMLQLQAKGATGPQADALQSEMKMLDLQKQRLSIQGKELEYWAKYQDTSRDLADRYEEAGAKLQDMPLDFAKATGQQFMQDLGMSGNGMLPSLLSEGTKYIFNVAGVDDALSAQQRLQNKRSYGLVGR